MAPTRPRGHPAGDDPSSTKTQAHSSTTKAPRNGHTAGPAPKDLATQSTGNGTNSSDPGGGIAWNTLATPVLHAYRHAHHLNTPAAFASPFNQMVLTNDGIGKYSPTMARRVEKRRQSKEHLAMAVRKDFNGRGVVEGECVVGFLYKVRWQDKHFRMKFTPKRNPVGDKIVEKAVEKG